MSLRQSQRFQDNPTRGDYLHEAAKALYENLGFEIVPTNYRRRRLR